VLKQLRQLRARFTPTAADANLPAGASTKFSLRELHRQNPNLARAFTWSTNPVLPLDQSPWLNLGCGEYFFDDFINVDLLPQVARVFAWNLLDIWPNEMVGKVAGVLCEDTLEHFFLNEQICILCNINRALQAGGVARILMPSLAKLIRYSTEYVPADEELLHATFGVQTGADALNMGMRFGGHRWLHDEESLARLAALCGFSSKITSCAQSTVPMLDKRNLRDETNSLSFAADLLKVHPLDLLPLVPSAVRGARVVESAGADATLYMATSDRSTVEYVTKSPIPVDVLSCINIRSANLSSFDEHNLKTLVLDGRRRDKPWYFDETMKSRACMNLANRHEVATMLRGAMQFSRLRFSPAAREGQYFTLGGAELFVRAV